MWGSSCCLKTDQWINDLVNQSTGQVRLPAQLGYCKWNITRAAFRLCFCVGDDSFWQFKVTKGSDRWRHLWVVVLFFFSLNAAWRLSWLQEHLIILLWRWWWCSSEAQSTVREALGLITFNLLTLNAHLPMMSDGSFSYAHRVSSNASWRVLDPTVVSPSTECLSVWNIL